MIGFDFIFSIFLSGYSHQVSASPEHHSASHFVTLASIIVAAMFRHHHA